MWTETEQVGKLSFTTTSFEMKLDRKLYCMDPHRFKRIKWTDESLICTSFLDITITLSLYTKECKLLWEKLGRKILEKGGNYEKNSIRLWYGNIQCFSTCGYLFLYFYSKLLFRTNLWHKIFHQFVYFSRYIIANGNIINGKSYWRFIVIDAYCFIFFKWDSYS